MHGKRYQTPLLLSLQQMVDGATSNNLKWILVDAMVFFGDLTQDIIDPIWS